MEKQIEKHQTQHAGVTVRAIILGLALIPVNTYFIMANYVGYWSTLGTTMALIYSVVIVLTVLVAVNSLIRRLSPRLALKQGELLTIFVMLSVSSAISGHDVVQSIVPAIPGGHWFATPENEWQDLFWRHLPDVLIIEKSSKVEGFFQGESSFYTQGQMHYWVRPVLWWSLLLTAILWVMVCLSTLLRKQWVEHERLSYPIVQLPLAMTNPKGRFFKSRMMWIGFAIAGGINLINGIHVFLPAFPEIPIRSAELGQYITEEPWNAIKWTPFYILPFGVGLGFIMPLEMSFSLWFFYWVWKAERILGSAIGLQGLPNFPYNNPQAMGSYLALAIFAIIGGRRHFYSILKGIFRPQPYESKEPMKYRWAVIGLIGGLLFLAAFSYQMGMAVWTILLYFLVYYLFAMSVSRIRAEVGPPTHELNRVDAPDLLATAFGTRRFSTGSLVMMAYYRMFNRRSRSHPMPHTLEGFKVAEESGMNSGRLVAAMMIAAMVGAVAAFWAFLTVAYQTGLQFDAPSMAKRPHHAVQNWLYYPTNTNVPATIFMGVGFLVTGFIWWMRRIFPFWPFHPAGYAIASNNFTFGWLWFSVFVSWTIKSVLLRFGGIGLYRKAYPLFLGLILGEYLVGGGWVLIRLITGIQVYSFYR
ncbi:DUF6785 family protein [Candidatus Poribacteria bacterium]